MVCFLRRQVLKQICRTRSLVCGFRCGGISAMPKRPLWRFAGYDLICGGNILCAYHCWHIYILRAKMPDAERPYKAFGYPVLPAIYILMGIAFCILL
jgi:hypothetical protein